jgi:hypothetical protein
LSKKNFPLVIGTGSQRYSAGAQRHPVDKEDGTRSKKKPAHMQGMAGWVDTIASSLFAWLISHQPTIFFSQNKPATSNQPTVLFSQNKPAPAKRTG